MVRSALLATPLKLSPSTFSSRAAVGAVLHRAGSSGRLQPCSWLKASRSGSKVFCSRAARCSGSCPSPGRTGRSARARGPPDLYLCSSSSESATAATCSGSPRRTSTPAGDELNGSAATRLPADLRSRTARCPPMATTHGATATACACGQSSVHEVSDAVANGGEVERTMIAEKSSDVKARSRPLKAGGSKGERSAPSPARCSTSGRLAPDI